MNRFAPSLSFSILPLLACLGGTATLAAGCHTPGPSTDEAPVSAGPSVAFRDCPLHLDQPDGPRAECATFPMPLEWNATTKAGSGRTIPIFVQRLRGTAEGPHKQLWMIQGGPGAPGSFFSHDFEHLAKLDPSVDFYTFDHRGMGRSSRISCPGQESDASDSGFTITPAETATCMDSLAKEWGSSLGAFSTTYAAHDLHAIIEQTRLPSQQVFVFGVSYGTHFTHRYLQLYPQHLAGAILDGVAVNMKFDEKDVDQNAIVKDFFDYCAKDDFCREKVGGDSWTELGGVLERIEDPASPCASLGLTKKLLRGAVTSLVRAFATRAIAPAIIHRLARCNADDKAALGHLIETMRALSRPSAQTRLVSDLAGNNIILGELWRGRPQADIERDYATTFSASTKAIDLAPIAAAWKERFGPYRGAELTDRWAATNTPVLLMNGDLDPQTTKRTAAEAAKQLKAASPNGGKYQYYFEVPRALHGLLAESPVKTPGAEQCGTQLLVSFLKAPTTKPSGACLDDVLPIDFHVPVELSTLFLGTPDAWGSDAE